MKLRRAIVSVILCAGCALHQAPESPGLADGEYPPLSEVLRVVDTRTGQDVSLDELLDAAASADVVFLGETHLDEVTHRLERAVYDGLLRRKPGDMVLGLEMFHRGDQSTLDAYLAGEIDEAQLMERADVWSNYRTGYRGLVERAREAGAPVFASNVPPDLGRQVANGGADEFAELTRQANGQLPAKLFDNSDEYWERFERVVRGHAHMITGGKQRRMYSMQSLWDNTMGDSCARALREHPHATVLHVNGGFHSAYHQGTVAQLLKRSPQARVLTVSIDPTDDPAGVRIEGEPEADYQILTQARARGLKEGTHAVYTGVELRFRLVGAVDSDEPLPLVLWLSSDGARTDDAARYWEHIVGNRARVAVVQMPYRQEEPQLYVSGRWYWPDTFSEDVFTAINGLERIQRYVSQYWPTRGTVIAGTGTGATVVVASALHADGLPGPRLAFEPADYVKLRELALPLSPPEASASVYVSGEDRGWWDREADAYRGIGAKITLAGAADPGLAVREAVGLSLSPDRTTRKVAVIADTPLARQWARLVASAQHPGDPIEISADGAPMAFAGEHPAATFGASTFADGRGLPRYPSPFGGTTVVVLPQGMSDDEADAWLSLARHDVLEASSRFFHLKVARIDGKPGLSEVLDSVRSAGRSNVLLVPAVFCASADTMRDLQKAAGSLDGLSVTWLPGLGGSIPASERVDELDGE